MVSTVPGNNSARFPLCQMGISQRQILGGDFLEFFLFIHPLQELLVSFVVRRLQVFLPFPVYPLCRFLFTLVAVTFLLPVHSYEDVLNKLTPEIHRSVE